MNCAMSLPKHTSKICWHCYKLRNLYGKNAQTHQKTYRQHIDRHATIVFA